MENILIIPGSKWQVPLISKSKSMGYRVININPYDNSPGFEKADIIYKYDIMRISNYIDIIKKLNIAAVISDECDIATPVVAELADDLGVRGIGKEKAKLFTNKFCMREFAEEKKFACPKYRLARNKQEALEFFNNLNRKMIIKPIDSNSSRGVYTILSQKDLEENFKSALDYSSSDKAVICEEYIEGVEFTVDGIMTDFGHTSLAISEKEHYSYNENIASSLRFSYKNKKFDYDLLRKLNDDLLNSTGLTFGLTHVEYKYRNGKFVLIEMGARGGGNLISAYIVPVLTGIDTYEAYIQMAMGMKVNKKYEIADKYRNREVILKFFDIPLNPDKRNIVSKIDGLDLLRDNNNIIKFELNFKVGEEITIAENDSMRMGYYIAYADTTSELDNIINNIQQKFVVTFEE